MVIACSKTPANEEAELNPTPSATPVISDNSKQEIDEAEEQSPKKSPSATPKTIENNTSSFKKNETNSSSNKTATTKPTATPAATRTPVVEPTPASCGAVGHTADGTCTICGKVKVSNCDHNRVTNNVCMLCGAEVCMWHGHTDVGVCPVCGSVKHSSRGHTEKGVCDACGSTIAFVEGAKEHYHGNGKDNGQCPVCGLFYEASIDVSSPSGAGDGTHVFEYHWKQGISSCPVCGLTWCPECGSESHTVHPAPTPAPTPIPVTPEPQAPAPVVPTCPTCGATDHTVHPIPTCPTCGATDHTTHPPLDKNENMGDTHNPGHNGAGSVFEE